MSMDDETLIDLLIRAADEGAPMPAYLYEGIKEYVATHPLTEEPTEWLPATFSDLLPGDRVRIGQEEADVTKVHRGLWHARNREWIDNAGKVRDHQTRWDHEELRVDLTANPGLHVYPLDLACEVLCDSDRAASLIIQSQFPRSTVVS